MKEKRERTFNLDVDRDAFDRIKSGEMKEYYFDWSSDLQDKLCSFYPAASITVMKIFDSIFFTCQGKTIKFNRDKPMPIDMVYGNSDIGQDVWERYFIIKLWRMRRAI